MEWSCFQVSEGPSSYGAANGPSSATPKDPRKDKKSVAATPAVQWPLSSRWFAANLVHLEGTHSRLGGSQHWTNKCSNRAHLQTQTTCPERCRPKKPGFLDDVRPRSFPLFPHERICFPSSLSQWSWPILYSYLPEINTDAEIRPNGVKVRAFSSNAIRRFEFALSSILRLE